jgi:hypothetical protein
VLTGNLVTGAFQVERRTEARVEMVANIADLTDSRPPRKAKGKRHGAIGAAH